MKFCPVCERVMTRSTAEGRVVYLCPCGERLEGAPEDARIGGETFGHSDLTERFGAYVRNIPLTLDATYIRYDCPCGLDYAALAVMGPTAVSLVVCKCGHTAKYAGSYLSSDAAAALSAVSASGTPA